MPTAAQLCTALVRTVQCRALVPYAFIRSRNSVPAPCPPGTMYSGARMLASHLHYPHQATTYHDPLHSSSVQHLRVAPTAAHYGHSIL